MCEHNESGHRSDESPDSKSVEPIRRGLPDCFGDFRDRDRLESWDDPSRLETSVAVYS